MLSDEEMTKEFAVNALTRRLEALENDPNHVLSKAQLRALGLTDDELAMIDSEVRYQTDIADPKRNLSPLGLRWWRRVLEIGRRSKAAKSREKIRKVEIDAAYVLADFDELSDEDRCHFVDGDAHWQMEKMADNMDGFPVYAHLPEVGECATTWRNEAQQSAIRRAIERLTAPPISAEERQRRDDIFQRLKNSTAGKRDD